VDQAIDPADPDALDAIPVGPSPGRTVGIAAAWIAVGLVIGLSLWLFWTNVVDQSGSSTVESYTAGEQGQRYSSVRDGFRVELPTTPRRRELDEPGGRTVIVDSRPGDGYSFSVTRSPQAETGLENYVTTLNTAAGQIAQSAGGEIVSQTDPIPYIDVAVKDVVFRKGNAYYRNRLVLTTDRLFIVQAMVEGKDQAPFDRLWASFARIGPGVNGTPATT
jgi:hypothetical protein